MPLPARLPGGIVNHGATLRPVSATERTITTILVAAAIAAWFVVAFVLAFVSPENDAGAQLLGAVVFGSAVALTSWPLLWSATRHRPGACGRFGVPAEKPSTIRGR